MDNRMTFKQYRNVDLLVFAVITAIFEAVAAFASSKWFSLQAMAISVTLALILIVMHRWGAYAGIIAVVGGAVYCIASSASLPHYLIYCGGNLFTLISLIYFKLWSKERVRKNFFMTLLYAITAYASMCLGRWLLSLPFGAGFSDLVGFMVSDSLSLLFAVILLIVFRGVDGLIEDQKAYLFRLDREKKEKNEGYGEE